MKDEKKKKLISELAEGAGRQGMGWQTTAIGFALLCIVVWLNEVLDEDLYFIQKPFTIQDLADKVRQVMDG